MDVTEEKISKHLGLPYVYLKDKETFVLQNGVAFTKDELQKGLNIEQAYNVRSGMGKLYDYETARLTGELVMKPSARKEEKAREPWSVLLLCIALMTVSAGCMYMSTVHTALYLKDYVDPVSAWIMSAVITIYCATAFEVAVLFTDRNRRFLAAIFSVLWLLVISFSMLTTVSVFYDRFNFNTVERSEDVEEDASWHVSLELLQKKEEALRESIASKEDDIRHRQSQEYSTRTQQVELLSLQEALQSNLDEQGELILSHPEAVKDTGEKAIREGLFDFLGRHMGIDAGLLEFIMSTLAAVFINLIAPLSVSAVTGLTGGFTMNAGKEKEDEDSSKHDNP